MKDKQFKIARKKWFIYMTYWSKHVKSFFLKKNPVPIIAIFLIILFQIEVKIEESWWYCFYQFNCIYYENYLIEGFLLSACLGNRNHVNRSYYSSVKVNIFWPFHSNKSILSILIMYPLKYISQNLIES